MTTRRSYSGGAKPTKLSVAAAASDLTLSIADPTGWPTGVNGPFFITIDRGKTSEEKALVTARSGNSLNVAERGADGTSPMAHLIDAVVEHVWTATDADEANKHVASDTIVHGVSSPVVGESDTQTLTNKTLDGDENTFRDIPSAAVRGLDAKQASQDAALDAHKTSADHDNRYFHKSFSDARYVNVVGDEMDGPLLLPLGPVSGRQAVHMSNLEEYFAQEAEAFMPKAGGEFTGPVSGLTPAEPAEFATKDYTDKLVDGRKYVVGTSTTNTRQNNIFSGNGLTACDFTVDVKNGRAYEFHALGLWWGTIGGDIFKLELTAVGKGVFGAEFGRVISGSATQSFGLSGLYIANADEAVRFVVVGTRVSGTGTASVLNDIMPGRMWAVDLGPSA